ncbi:MAG: class I SAM-dependent methyltransferase [Planctomycetes bacterium]|nr:class I SAM-dependent methyltransferase [Planctomycetota bacterium]
MNRRNYGKTHIVSCYIHSQLQKPEAIIFDKYQAHISGKRVLDIGCGAGRTTSHLYNLSNNYTGIDYSFEMIDVCRERFKDVSFIHGDARNLNMLEDGVYDFVLFAYNGLDSVCHEGRLKGIREIYRVLSQNGLFVFSAHNRNHRDAISRPAITFALDPHKMIDNVKRFVISTQNHTRNRKKQQFKRDYSILNDRAHDFAMLTYYIDKNNQVSQLANMGFDVIEMFDVFGNVLEHSSYDGDSAWIYYVARKRG